MPWSLARGMARREGRAEPAYLVLFCPSLNFQSARKHRRALFCGGYGGYGRYGGPWGYGGGATRTTVHQYTEANVYIDLVDSREHKMVWQGVATFTVTDKMQEQLRETVYNTVEKIFAAFPVPAPAGS